MPQLNQIPKNLVKGHHFTERSRGTLRSPRVVLLLHPTFKLMSHPLPGEMSHVIVVEFPNSRLNGWAAFAGALNLTSKEYMSAEVSDEALALYKRIEWNGNNGWADEWGKRDAIRDLDELKRMGELDIGLLRGYMLSKKSHIAIDRLIKLAVHLTQ